MHLFHGVCLHLSVCVCTIDCKKKMDDTSPLPSTIEKWSKCILVRLLPSWVNDVIWSLSLRSRDSFRARVCAVVSRWGAADSNSHPNNHRLGQHCWERPQKRHIRLCSGGKKTFKLMRGDLVRRLIFTFCYDWFLLGATPKSCWVSFCPSNK